jgi:hypothetical protein
MQQAAELRRAKEHFVSNLHGTTKWEVFCVVSCLPLCLLIGEDTYMQQGRQCGSCCTCWVTLVVVSYLVGECTGTDILMAS